MSDDAITLPRVLQNAFPGRPDLASKRLAILHAVDDEPDLPAVRHEAGGAQFDRPRQVNLAPPNEVSTKSRQTLSVRLGESKLRIPIFPRLRGSPTKSYFPTIASSR